jgi:DNA repair photolyase
MKIYEPTGRAREYSPLALNYFKGCTHNCSYCYVNRLNAAFGTGLTQDKCAGPTEAGFRELELSAKKMQGCNQQILLSFTGDPYADMSPETTRRVLEILNRYNHKVAILTKGGNRVLNDIDLFKQFGDRIKIGATLTFDNDKDSLEWEPGATLPGERMESLRILSELGIKTWASFEPVIKPEQSLNLLQQISGFMDHVRIGKLNDYKGLDKAIDWTKFIQDVVSSCRETGLKFYIKNDLAAFNQGTQLFPEERDSEFLNL